MTASADAVSRRRRGVLWAICLVALALRLLYVWDIRAQPLFTHLVVDQQSYDSWAVEIAAGNWIGDAVFYQDPFYPYALAVIYGLFGRNLPLVYVLQSALSAVCCLAVFGIGRRAFGDARVGLWAAGLWALYEVDFFYQAQILKTGPGTCLVILALWLLFVADEWPHPAAAAAAGIVAGLLPLYRGNYLLVVPLLVAWLVLRWSKSAGSAALGRSAALVLGVAAVLGTVALRNHAVSGEWVLTTAQAGQNFYLGNNELARGRYDPPPFVRPNPRFEAADFAAEAERRTGRPMSASEVSHFWFGEALRWIRAHPADALRLQWRKLRILFYRLEAPDNLNFDFFRDELSFVLRLPLVSFWLAGPFGLAGLALALARRRGGMLALYLVVYGATVLASFVFSRYRMPMVPVLLVFAAFAIVAAHDAWRQSDRKTLAVLGASLILGAGLSYPRWTRPKYDTAWARMGSAYIAARDYPAALEAYRRSLEIDPRPLHSCIGLGRAYEGLDDAARAAGAYRQCAEAHPRSALPHLALGALELRAGRTEEGAAELRRALALEPGNPQAQEMLRRLGYGLY